MIGAAVKAGLPFGERVDFEGSGTSSAAPHFGLASPEGVASDTKRKQKHKLPKRQAPSRQPTQSGQTVLATVGHANQFVKHNMQFLGSQIKEIESKIDEIAKLLKELDKQIEAVNSPKAMAELIKIRNNVLDLYK